jgi:hypothetical protein
MAEILVKIALLINVVVLVPVCFGLFTRRKWIEAAYGSASPARGILSSIYLAILLVSTLLLVRPDVLAAAGLLLVQIVYKVTTPLTVGTFRNRVVISNLLVAAFHTFTLVALYSQ